MLYHGQNAFKLVIEILVNLQLCEGVLVELAGVKLRGYPLVQVNSFQHPEANFPDSTRLFQEGPSITAVKGGARWGYLTQLCMFSC